MIPEMRSLFRVSAPGGAGTVRRRQSVPAYNKLFINNELTVNFLLSKFSFKPFSKDRS